ncbi:MAG: M6 family metalloprotease domain-containing protein [Muribaculaceae bacterium]
MNFKYIIAAVAASVALNASAVPAKRGLRTVVQPDGTELIIQKVGDESRHFTLTADGMLLARDANGQYSYARIDKSGQLVSSGIRALNANARPSGHRYLMQNIDEVDMTVLDKVRAKRPAHSLNAVNAEALRLNGGSYRNAKAPVRAAGSLPQSGMGRFTSNFPRTGKIKGLVILVEYTDVKFNSGYKTDAKTYFNDLLHKEGFSEYKGTGCATEYFRAQSNGLFDPEFDLYGPVTLPNPMSYYGANDSYGDDKAPHMMVVHACQQLDKTVDFSQYDNDGDGYVDNVFIFYAGQGEASYGSDDTVWPHSWEVSSGTGSKFRLDGVIIDRYACTNEWERSTPDGVGTFIHEFSHVMGLPDLYHTTSSSASYTPGSWSVLDYGPYNNDGRTPPNYSIYERNAMGWINPELLDGEVKFVSLEEIGGSNRGCIIQTDKTNEFFLLENRQLTGWDKYLPGHGMLVWHVDYQTSVFDNNSVNNNSSHQYVDIIEANNSANSNSDATMAGYTWPGTSNKTEFGPNSSPALKSWSGYKPEITLMEISENNGVITFGVNGVLQAPVADEAVTGGSDWFNASWTAVDEAESYELTVTATTGATGSGSETAEFTGQKVPQGWFTNATSYYTSAGNYGEASPSLKMDKDAQMLISRMYGADITGLSFWHKFNGNFNGGSNIQIEAFVPTGEVDGTEDPQYTPGIWEAVDVITPSSTASVYTAAPARIKTGARAVRFIYTKSGGNVGLDDITVNCGASSSHVVEGYDGLNVGNVTGYTVTGLPEANSYTYRVVAVCANGRSKASNPVTYVPSAGVDDIVADSADGDRITVNGLTVSVTTAAGRVDVYDMSGRHIATARPTGATAVLSLPREGLYLVRGTGTSKVVVK